MSASCNSNRSWAEKNFRNCPIQQCHFSEVETGVRSWNICTKACSTLILGSGTGTKILTLDISILVPLQHVNHCEISGEGAKRTIECIYLTYTHLLICMCCVCACKLHNWEREGKKRRGYRKGGKEKEWREWVVREGGREEMEGKRRSRTLRAHTHCYWMLVYPKLLCWNIMPKVTVFGKGSLGSN